MHIVTDPAIIPLIYRTRQFTFRPTLAEFVGIGFGTSNDALEKVFIGEKNQFQEFKTLLVKQLTTSVELDQITNDAQIILRDKIQQYLLPSSGQAKTVDLMAFVSDLIFRASVAAVISNSAELGEVDCLKNLEIFDSMCPLVFAGIPMKYIPPGCKAREALFEKLRASTTIHKSRLLTAQEQFMKSLNGSQEDVQRVQLFLLWASVANSMPAVFWTLYYLLSHDGAWDAIRGEVKAIQAKKQDPQGPFTSADLNDMVKMQSAFTESLRLASSLRVLRDVTEDFEFDIKLESAATTKSRFPSKYFLRKGSIVVGFTPQLHMDSEIFEAPTEFRWDRFLTSSTGEPAKFYRAGKLVNDPMRAFGGGAHLCPGRKFIANEVKALIATLATSCEIELVNPDKKAEFDMWRQGAGIPQPKEPVLIRLLRSSDAG
eukprot:Sro1196_g251450.2  (429) ;mRNA; r:6646-7932